MEKDQTSWAGLQLDESGRVLALGLKHKGMAKKLSNQDK